MIVVDTSAVIAALVGRPAVPGLVERLAGDGDLHAPHLIDVELLQALRRLEATREIGADRARDAVTDFGDLALTRYPHVHLAERIWELRRNVSAYDGAFVALSEALDVPLVTCDARLSRASGLRGTVELFEA